MPRPRFVLSLALLAVLTACGDKHYFSVGMDGHATPVDKNGVPLPGQALPAPKPDMSANPHAAMPSAEPADGPINVTIELDPKLGVNPASFKCGFLAARRNEGDTADAVARFDPKLPASLVLAPAAGMHGGGLAKGPHKLFARLDGDGDAGTIEAGDVMGMLDNVVPGGAPVTLVLGHVMTAEEVAAPERAAPVAPFAGGAMSAPHEATPEELAGPRFSGTIELPASHANLNGKYRLFLYLRNPQNVEGMPLAVKAFDKASFPLSFDVGTENIPLDVENKAEMISGKVKVMARLSVSGALKGGPGDLEVTPLLTPPAKDLHLVLDQVRTQ